MKYFSMFSGIGGFELGIDQAYEDRRIFWDGIDRRPRCVGFSEIDKYAISIYEKHFPNHVNFGDATKINATELPDFDLLVGGFPCQAFSIAGKRAGFNDTRGTLFFDIARVLKEKRPRHFLLENVKGLLSHDNGNTFKTIISTLAELGYDLEWQVLNSKNFGVPQNRERVFIIGHLGRCCGRQVFPLGQSDVSFPEQDRTKQRQQGVSVSYRVGVEKQELSHTLDTMYKKGLPAKGQPRTGIMQLAEKSRIRRLTPTECERLQAYPDGWTEGVSDTQRYKCLGNSVTVSVIEHIIKELYYVKKP